MKEHVWIGGAVGFALLSVALPSCSKGGNPPAQTGSGPQPSVAGELAWNKKTERQLLDAIAQAPANGLKPDLFLKGELPKDDAQRNAVLTAAALRYADALARGYVDPKKVSAIYTLARPSTDVRTGLAQAIQSGSVGDWLASLPPQTEEYRALSQAHLHFLQLAAKGTSTPIPNGKPIRPGRVDKRIPLVVAALQANGIIGPSSPTQSRPGAHAGVQTASDRYTSEIAQAVRQVQTEFGLTADGVIRGDTIDALNADPSYRARQLAIAMERLRWLVRDPPPTRIDVNTAASLLDYWRDGALRQQLRTINGQPGKWTTPQIQAPIFELVANPYWHVPDRIVEDELSKKSAAYLAANDFSWREGRLIQLPGPKNSLGVVKFDMRDPQQIYLHDTPFKSWFSADERHRSHGCVRVQNALDFALELASEDGVQDRFQEALASGDETYVKLKREIVVRLFYRTAFWDGSQVQFRSDIYGWDDDVARALGLEQGASRAAYRQQEDVGP
ncbi:MAG TPA: L,D-transpeptidase family protein [Sphingomicrobium sp.]